MNTFDLLLKGASVVCSEGVRKTDIGVKNGVAELGVDDGGAAENVFQAEGQNIFPGTVDFQRAGRNGRRSPLQKTACLHSIKKAVRRTCFPMTHNGGI
ncbi:hypothetical protein [Bacillus haynesii]|uniref:hypothetical protein n=1 Tax=Bacillus haynesii TaxID=1925021 RepID=UPI0022826093|nr:hypothetical protein [Bacillus haynesii]MCY8370300.1 hypothetical protein [Bacillus haynesii]MCY8670139.1 hypothetical protein [Bacillus haynesii]